MLNGLDLFSGIGGLSLALEPWVRTVAYCEQDPYAQAVLLSRMRDGLLDDGPIWDDVRTLQGDHFGARIDFISGGVPCQDFSVAGHGKGLAGERSGLFSEFFRLCEELEPTWAFLENVPAVRTRGLRDIVSRFASLRYDCRWTVLAAASVGAPHLRERWFLLAKRADADCDRLPSICSPFDHYWEDARGHEPDGLDSDVSDADGEPLRDEQQRRPYRFAGAVSPEGKEVPVAHGEAQYMEPTSSKWWSLEPHLGRVADGVPFRVDRLRCLGNGVVPLQARRAFEILSGIKKETTT